MELERVEMVQKEVKEWITRNAPSMIAEKQRQFQEVMAPIAKSDKEKRENAKLQKNQKSIDDYDVDFNEFANIAKQTKQRSLAVTATVH